ncbi:hypothetical protein [Deinococcus hohokamensis]|uniref:Uncharacterized protein n=1 Tax=Deinococcus hohokamensis TaxID=309883 RepID=A0ABV9I345_9DEIO
MKDKGSGRFKYLLSAPGTEQATGRKLTPAPDGRRKGETAERLEAVYLRKETVRAVWREVKKDGGESVSELVEDLLLLWLRGRS